MIREYDRMAGTYNKLRGLDFGINYPWRETDTPSYKGCEPMKKGKKPVKCD